MSRLVWRLGAPCLLALTLTCGAEPLLADDPAGLSDDRLARAKELIQSWNRPAPAIEFTEKWRAPHPVSAFDYVTWAGDAERIAAITGESEVLVIDSAQGNELARFRGRAEDRADCEGAKGRVHRIAISHDGKYVAIGFSTGVAIWDWSSDKVVFVHKEPQAVRDMRISSDGKWLCMIDSRVHGGRYGLLDGVAGRTFTLSTMPGVGLFKVIMDPTGERMVFRSEPLRNYVEVAMDLPDGQGVGISPVLGNGLNEFAMGKRVRIAGMESGSLFVYMRMEPPPATPSGSATTPATSAPTTKKAISLVGYFSAVGQIRNVLVSPDDQWGLAYDNNDRIAMIRVDVAYSQWRGRLKQGRIVALRPPLNEVVSITPSGEMVCHAIAAPTDHPAWDCEKWARDALTREAYDEIDAVAKLVASDREPFAFKSHSSKFLTLCHILKSDHPDPERAEQLDGQYQKFRQARPHNPFVAYWEADRLIDEGWEARGSGYADTVLPQQREAFDKFIEQAHAVLKPVMEGDEPPLDLYSLWFAVARAKNSPRADLDFHVEKLLRRLDRYHPALGEAAVRLLPRWGGAKDDASAFALMVAERFAGDAGDIAYARITMQLAPHEKDSTFSVLGNNKGTMSGFDVERATRGTVLALEQEPHSQEVLARCKRYNAIVRSPEIAEALTKNQNLAD